MTLISFEFILFCSISLIVFFIVPKKLQWLVILLSSIFFIFYDNFTIGTLIQLILVLLTSYFCGILIDKYTGTKKSIFFLFLGICVLLGQLLYLKYTNFIFTSINHIFNIFNIN